VKKNGSRREMRDELESPRLSLADGLLGSFQKGSGRRQFSAALNCGHRAAGGGRPRPGSINSVHSKLCLNLRSLGMHEEFRAFQASCDTR
jgi:hypothetical protein